MLFAKYIMLTHRKTFVKPDATGKEIAYKLISTRLPGLTVIDENMEVIGIVTEFDLLGNIREGLELNKITAEKIMSKNPQIADPGTTAEKLMEIMLEKNFTIIPIVQDNKLVGIVDRTLLIETYVERGIMPIP